MAEHRAAFEYDWRARFHLPLTVVGTKAMRWGEAYRLAGVLARDPASAVAASVAGWHYPLSREALALADLYDLQHHSKVKRKPKPYPRPWVDKDRKRHGTGRYTPNELRAVLSASRAHARELEGAAHG